MILPNRHIRLSESLFGLGSFVIEKSSKPISLDDIWSDFERSVASGSYPFAHSFENLILAIDLMHMLGAIETDNQGRIVSCNY